MAKTISHHKTALLDYFKHHLLCTLKTTGAILSGHWHALHKVAYMTIQ